VLVLLAVVIGIIALIVIGIIKLVKFAAGKAIFGILFG